MNQEFSFTATGDSFITRRLPAADSYEFKGVSQVIKKGQFRFTNFEMTTPGLDKMPSAVSGGTWASAVPEVIDDIRKYGFNCTTWSNNHTLDYLYNGLLSTKYHLEKAGMIHAGVGNNLAEASSPSYLETSQGRIALIGLTSTFHETWMAGEQRKDGPGRPGVNGLQFSNIYQMTRENLSILKGISQQIGINTQRNLDKMEGFLEEDDSNQLVFGNHKFIESETTGHKRIPNKNDMERVLRAINEANRQADYVIVSVHSHEIRGKDKYVSAEFIEEAARLFIDEGAHAVIGHGPHVLRGIEIYRNRPIFYSLGNFIFQNDTVNYLPADFYEKYNIPQDANVADAIDRRSKNDTRGLGINPYVWESVIAHWKMEN